MPCSAIRPRLAKANSGTRKEFFFCPDCGIRIYNALGSLPDTVNLKTGTLDDTKWFRPALQVWTDNKQPWVEIPGECKRFPGNPG